MPPAWTHSTSGDRNSGDNLLCSKPRGFGSPYLGRGTTGWPSGSLPLLVLRLTKIPMPHGSCWSARCAAKSRLQYTSRTEPRDKVNYSVIQLMIAKAADADERVESLDTRINLHIADIHEREWIYSYVRRRLVNRQEFLDDVRSIIDNGVPYLN